MTVASAQILPSLEGIVVPDMFVRGYRFNMGWATNRPSTPQLAIDSRHRIRNDFAISTFLRLLRFLPSATKERWLFDILTLIRVNPALTKAILKNKDWQPCLFHLLSETIEEISSIRAKLTNSVEVDHVEDAGIAGSVAKSTNCYQRSPLRQKPDKVDKLPLPLVSRYDLIVKLYSSLLGESLRQGGDHAFQNVEQAASLQRVCVNGHETFQVLLSHVLAELTENGTIGKNDSSGDASEANRALKNSAKIVTKAILSNGSDGLSMASAVEQWRCLRHLSAVTVAVITVSGYVRARACNMHLFKRGILRPLTFLSFQLPPLCILHDIFKYDRFGVAQLLDYRNDHAESIDKESGGLHGIRLGRGFLPGISAADAAIESSFNTQEPDSGLRRRNERDCYRRTCVTLASQLLSLLDAFIFPAALDASAQKTQLHGLALVRSTEPRLGQAQGPLLASLLRLSMLLMSHLEPSSVAFLQCCSRLRCLFHWTLELIRESSVASGGYSAAFGVHTAKLDRLVLAVVLQGHRALSRCSAVLIEIDSSPTKKVR